MNLMLHNSIRLFLLSSDDEKVRQHNFSLPVAIITNAHGCILQSWIINYPSAALSTYGFYLASKGGMTQVEYWGVKS